MNTLIPAWKQPTAEEDCRNITNHSSTRPLKETGSSRRRISSSLAPWEKQVTSDHYQHGSSPVSSNAEGAVETPLLTTLANAATAADDDDSKKQNNANDDVEHELVESTGDLAAKYHYTGNETSEDLPTQNDGNTNGGRRYSRISMIIIYGREALCILALILTTYASIQNR